MLEPVSLDVFVPSKNYAESQRFYELLGFKKVFDTGKLSQMRQGDVSFLLQDFFEPGLAKNLMLQLTVKNLDAAFETLTRLKGQEEDLKLRFTPPKDEAWGRVMYLWGPAGELWYLTEG